MLAPWPNLNLTNDGLASLNKSYTFLPALLCATSFVEAADLVTLSAHSTSHAL